MGPPSELQMLLDLGWAPEFTFLTSSQEMWLLLAQTRRQRDSALAGQYNQLTALTNLSAQAAPIKFVFGVESGIKIFFPTPH